MAGRDCAATDMVPAPQLIYGNPEAVGNNHERIAVLDLVHAVPGRRWRGCGSHGDDQRIDIAKASRGGTQLIDEGYFRSGDAILVGYIFEGLVVGKDVE